MKLDPACAGCEVDSNVPDKHTCNYSKWPGLYDTIEFQRRQLMDGEEAMRQARHHDVLCIVLKLMYERLVALPESSFLKFTPDAEEWITKAARHAADLAYPPPKAEP